MSLYCALCIDGCQIIAESRATTTYKELIDIHKNTYPLHRIHEFINGQKVA
jgi:hypothetical protein